MKKTFAFFGLLVLMVGAGCGRSKSEEKLSPSTLPHSLIGFWKYTGALRPDGTRMEPDAAKPSITEYTDGEMRYLSFFKSATGEIKSEWHKYRSYSLDGATMTDWETALPSNKVTFTIRFADANHLEKVSLEDRFVPIGTVSSFERMTAESVQAAIDAYLSTK